MVRNAWPWLGALIVGVSASSSPGQFDFVHPNTGEVVYTTQSDYVAVEASMVMECGVVIAGDWSYHVAGTQHTGSDARWKLPRFVGYAPKGSKVTGIQLHSREAAWRPDEGSVGSPAAWLEVTFAGAMELRVTTFHTAQSWKNLVNEVSSRHRQESGVAPLYAANANVGSWFTDSVVLPGVLEVPALAGSEPGHTWGYDSVEEVFGRVPLAGSSTLGTVVEYSFVDPDPFAPGAEGAGLGTDEIVDAIVAFNGDFVEFVQTEFASLLVKTDLMIQIQGLMAQYMIDIHGETVALNTKSQSIINLLSSIHSTLVEGPVVSTGGLVQPPGSLIEDPTATYVEDELGDTFDEHGLNTLTFQGPLSPSHGLDLFTLPVGALGARLGVSTFDFQVGIGQDMLDIISPWVAACHVIWYAGLGIWSAGRVWQEFRVV